MRYSEILCEKPSKRVSIMYHGTSSVYLRSILKRGLLAHPPRATYSRDSGMDNVGYDTFSGGVYLTSRRDSAVSNSEDSVSIHGGEPIVVAVQYVIGSEQVDEDDITSIIRFPNVLDSSTTVGSTLTVSDFLYILDHGGYSGAARRFISYFSNSRSFRRISRSASDSILVELFDYIIDWLRGRNGERRVGGVITSVFLDSVRHDSVFEDIMYRLMRQMSPSGSEAIRIARDIGYSGSTRIISISDAFDSGKLYYGSGNRE